MATTWLKALHRGSRIAAALGRSVDYISNGEKTEDGELIESYECDPCTAQAEFLLSKKLYAQRTGRDQGERDVIAYHIRMSFKPGEVAAEQALELGRELAMRWTRGKHQFIVAAHRNTNNPHVHIVYNSTNLDSDGKYQDFKGSAFALRRLSDTICFEQGLSVIEKPGLSKGYNRREYLGENKAPTVRDQLRELMDAAIQKSKDYDDFLAALIDAGVKIKRGKQMAFLIPGGKKFVQQDTLGDDYTVGAITKRLTEVPALFIPPVITRQTKFRLLIDIQEKILEGKGEAYENWAKVYNLKQMARTLIYLQENGIDSYDDLVVKSTVASSGVAKTSKQIRKIEARQKDIAELQKHIGTYRKTREVYKEYRASKRKSDFYENHRADIVLHEAAKKHFDSLGVKKLPSMQSLKQKYAILESEKKTLYRDYYKSRAQSRELIKAKDNCERILGISKSDTERISKRRGYDAR